MDGKRLGSVLKRTATRRGVTRSSLGTVMALKPGLPGWGRLGRTSLPQRRKMRAEARVSATLATAGGAAATSAVDGGAFT